MVYAVRNYTVNKSGTLLPGTTTRLTVAVTESPVKQEILNTPAYHLTVPMSLDFTSLIVDMVHQYAAQVVVVVVVVLVVVIVVTHPTKV